MRKIKWISVAFLSLFTIFVVVSGASAAEYKIRWFNNMNWDTDIVKNPNGYCTNLKADFLNPMGNSIGSAQYSGNLNVQTETSMTVTIPPNAVCANMVFSGTCTYKYRNDPVTTGSTSTTAAGCSNGDVVFMINNFGMYFSPKQ